MRSAAIALLAAVTAAAAAGAADAQDRGRRRGIDPRITLYDQPDFQGRSITLYGDASNLAGQGFNDRARSARIDGSWRLCEDKDYRSRCEPFGDDVRDFAPFRFNDTVSSVQQVGGRPGRGGYEGPAYGSDRPGAMRDGVEGRSVVFFRRPSRDGLDVAATDSAADAFCRSAGLSAAVYHDAAERGRVARDSEGRIVEDVPVLRDVLCRR